MHPRIMRSTHAAEYCVCIFCLYVPSEFRVIRSDQQSKKGCRRLLNALNLLELVNCVRSGLGLRISIRMHSLLVLPVTCEWYVTHIFSGVLLTASECRI